MTSLKRRLFVAVFAALTLVLLPLGSAVEADVTHYTTLPELQEATLITTVAQSSDNLPAGTTVAFRFDESVAATPPAPSGFVVYDRLGRGSSASEVSVKGDTVTAIFRDLDTVAKAHEVSLAVTKAGAVNDDTGHANAIGSVGLTRWKSRKARGPQGCLVMTGGNNLRRIGTNTAIDFAFSSCGPGQTTVKPRGLRLQMVDGRSIPGSHVRYHSTDPMSVTVTFPGRLARRHIGRVTVHGASAIYDYWDCCEYEEHFANEMQAIAISHRGNTVRPDLVSVKLLPNPRADRPDHAIFVFDQRVTDPIAGRFTAGTSRGVHAIVRRGHPRQVRVTLLAGATRNVTVGHVSDRAVRGGRRDEVPITNILTWRSVRQESTRRPDLLAAQVLDSSTNDLPVLTVLFAFDAELSGAPDARAFHVYGEDGTQYVADQCTLLPSPDSARVPAHVRCTFPDGPMDRFQLGMATVDAGAVQDADGSANLERSHWIV